MAFNTVIFILCTLSGCWRNGLQLEEYALGVLTQQRVLVPHEWVNGFVYSEPKHRPTTHSVGSHVMATFGAWKIASALAVGNSIVLKPSEIASLSLLRLGAIAQEAGLPDGVLNIVTGDGTETGSAMASHQYTVWPSPCSMG